MFEKFRDWMMQAAGRGDVAMLAELGQQVRSADNITDHERGQLNELHNNLSLMVVM